MQQEKCGCSDLRVWLTRASGRLPARSLLASSSSPLYIPRAFARKFGDVWSDMDSELQFVMCLIGAVICVLGIGGFFIYRSERTLSAAEVVAVTSKNACAALSVEKYLEENPNSIISAGRLSTFVDRCEPENLKNEYTRLMGDKK